jgi:hypothetical protein
MRQIIPMVTSNAMGVATLSSPTTPAFAQLDLDRPQQPVAQWAQTIVASEANEWYVAALDELRELKALKANWDLAGSPPISEEVLSAAIDVLDASQDRKLTEPHIAPVPGGGIQFEFSYRGRDIELSVAPRETEIGVVRVHPDGRIVELSIPNDPNAVRYQLDWLISGRSWL